MIRIILIIGLLFFSIASFAEDYDEEFRDAMEYITDEFGQIQGVGWRAD